VEYQAELIYALTECHSFRLNRLIEKRENETFTTHSSLRAMYGKARDLFVIACALRHQGMRKMGRKAPRILNLGS
jgi:hypothetical protein